MKTIDVKAEDQQQLIKKLQKQNDKLQKFYNEYKRVCRNEEERIKELYCLYQVAQFVVIESDMDVALDKIVHIVPYGWQYTKESCARITFKEKKYFSFGFFESRVCQSEEILIDNQIMGTIEVFYKSELGSKSNDPFLLEERNLLKGIANIISFYVKKQSDDENR
ncbi:MAG: hypothetical protein K8R67_08195, partial [Desulfobacteraceae bacterium]|nr:hypothetical protein [Desulfobacteraceae bacterium]